MTPKLGGLFKSRRRRRAKLEHEKPPINPRTRLLVRLLLVMPPAPKSSHKFHNKDTL